jgi:hypothetical protein
MDDPEARIRELLLRIRDLEREAEGLRARARRLIREAARTAAGGMPFGPARDLIIVVVERSGLARPTRPRGGERVTRHFWLT